MEKNNEDIPTSVIKGSGFVNVNWGEEKNGSVMLVKPDCVLLGVNNLPCILYATPGTNFQQYQIGDEIYKIRKLVLRSSFKSKSYSKDLNIEIPEWITDFRELEKIYLDNLVIDNLNLIKNLPLTHLGFRNVRLANEGEIVNLVNQMDRLKEISFDLSFHHIIPFLNQDIEFVFLETAGY
ncbi:hypothetical protein GZH53_01560 [Flavihumibacter sp. R14]|nr:hypothetical protein [Flavihumibacter soli]